MKKLSDVLASMPKYFNFPYESDFVTEYETYFNYIDIRLLKKYGNLISIFEIPELLDTMIQSSLIVNKYKYEGLYNSTKFEYNPIWNVDGTETTTTTYGEKTSDREYGEKVTDTTRGERTGNTSYSDYPYDTKEKTIDSETDTTENEYTDTSTEHTHTDTATDSEHVDVVEYVRGGNIGVTSTQHLIGEERNIVNFVFWDIVIDDVVKDITYPYYED